MNTLLYAMGGKSEDIFTSFTFDDGADQNNYDRVREKFDHHFTAKKNVIYERAKFNQRVQGQDEPVENFITDLYRLAEFGEYGSLRDEIIRDRLDVGLSNNKLSEKLQMNSGLTLEQTVQQARQSENVKKKQQGLIRSHTGQVNVESLTASKSGRPRKKTTSNKLKQPSIVSGDGPKRYMPDRQITRGERCVRHQKHNRQTFPGKDMLDVKNALNKVTLRNVVALKAV